MARRFSYPHSSGRGPNDPWFRVGDVDVGTVVLVTALSVVSILVWAIDKAQLLHIALIPDDVRSGEVWRVLTWPFANLPQDGRLLWTVIAIAIFWYLGREVEARVGKVRMAVFLAYLTVIPGIIGTLIDLPQAGIEPVEFAVFLTFVLIDPFARFMFNIPAWALGAVLVAIQVLQLLADDNDKGLLFLAVTLAVAALGARAMGLAEHTPWIPRLPVPGLTERSASRRGASGGGRRRRASSDRGGVVSGPWGETSRPASAPASTLPQPPGPPRGPTPADQDELDGLLDKIAAVGMNALSNREKDRLNELSRRLRGH